jgi:hypothetical protein
LLAAYELGLLEEEQRCVVEAHLAGCEACQEALYQEAEVTRAFQVDPGRYRRVAERVLDRHRAPAPTRWFERLRRALAPRVLVPAVAVAAAAVLAVVFLLPDTGKRSMDLASIEPIPYTLIETRAGGFHADSLFARGMSAYVGQDYAVAAEQLAAALTAAEPEWQLKNQALFFRGLSLLLAGDVDTAIEPLAAAAYGAPRPLLERTIWYRAQAHLLGDEIPEAIAMLEQLAESPVYGDRAQEQLAALR